MTLKKDAVVCVSLAGLVLVMAAFSRMTSQSEAPVPSPATAEAAESEVFHRPLYKLYVDAVNNNGMNLPDRDAWLKSARSQVMSWYASNEFSAPIDLFRAAAILGTSTEASDLDLAYELSVKAWTRGVRTARRLALETQDRLLLSVGQEQRYGTQSKWLGKPLLDHGTASKLLSPALKAELGLNGPDGR